MVKVMRISEIIYTNQGEGRYAGEPSIFIRLQGCNLYPPGCRWCDTPYAQPHNGGEEVSVRKVYEEARNILPYYNSWVCITGGEPLLQDDELGELVSEFKRNGYLVEIETNGTLPKPIWWTRVNSWVSDIKCPSSGMDHWARESEWFNTRECDQVKFVVGSEKDLDYIRPIIKRNLAKNPLVLVSPVFSPKPQLSGLETEYQREFFQIVWNFCLEERVRFSLQLHKITWGNKRGV